MTTTKKKTKKKTRKKYRPTKRELAAMKPCEVCRYELIVCACSWR